MPRLVFHSEKVTNRKAFLALCPFGAMEEKDGKITATAACKMCGVCVRKGEKGAAELVEDRVRPTVDKSKWSGLLVYADHVGSELHSVSFEMIGKARELAAVIHQPVTVLLLGDGVEDAARELLHYGVDKVLYYDQKELRDFRIDTYAAAMEDAVMRVKPAAILVGATPVGRQLAPRIAARLRTGLTADCTVLKMQENTDLVQIRPAFGGNIMAQIVTPDHRPQMATVRPKVMDAPKREEKEQGVIERIALPPEKLISQILVKEVKRKPTQVAIENASVLVVAGRGVKKQQDLQMLEHLAQLLGGQLACTRPMAECGWVDARRQVGLSGRTVRPKLIITCGVSGAIQFVAGMNHSDTIVAINQDENAAIFKTAHIGLVGDLYEIIPRLIRDLEKRKEARV